MYVFKELAFIFMTVICVLISNIPLNFTDQSAEELRKEKEQKKKTLIRKVSTVYNVATWFPWSLKIIEFYFIY